MIPAQKLREKFATFKGDVSLWEQIGRDVVETAEKFNRCLYYPKACPECAFILMNQNYFERLGYKVEVYCLGVDLTW